MQREKVRLTNVLLAKQLQNLQNNPEVSLEKATVVSLGEDNSFWVRLAPVAGWPLCE